jgi:hypothetical protein
MLVAMVPALTGIVKLNFTKMSSLVNLKFNVKAMIELVMSAYSLVATSNCCDRQVIRVHLQRPYTTEQAEIMMPQAVLCQVLRLVRLYRLDLLIQHLVRLFIQRLTRFPIRNHQQPLRRLPVGQVNQRMIREQLMDMQPLKSQDNLISPFSY